MSGRLFEDDVVFLQRLLKSTGFYNGKIDGVWGKKTDAGVEAFEARFRDIREALGELDLRSESNLHTLHPRAQETARIFIRKVLDAGITVRIISGTRTYAEQNALFRIGRFGDPRAKVTNSRGGQSNHNFGIAWDVGVFKEGKYLTDSPLYTTAAEKGLFEGLEWGGHWTTFKDRPHYQVATGLSIDTVRERFERGEAYL
jgi:peptidoglycan L-alanyl-D-glutamate endopeptidase CwlK